MSFKDVRDLGEHLKLLGYPHAFPLQALGTQNGSLAAFCIVADILQWLAGLLEPGTILNGSVQSEEDRIQLIRSATEFFVTKSAIKLNPRKLYAASMVTAIELQKITHLLIAPTETEQDKNDEENYRSLNQIDIGDKMDDLRRARELSIDLTQRGSALYDLLAKELVNRETRIVQANRPIELASVERTMKNAIGGAQLKLQSSRAQLESGRVELNALNSKLQRKRGELERTKQRLEALQKIRPPHMEEFEECERELQELFQNYFKRVHVRDSLRVQYEARTKRNTPVSSPMMALKANESSMPFIPEGLIDDDADFDDEPQLNGGSIGIDSIGGASGGDDGSLGVGVGVGMGAIGASTNQHLHQRRKYGLDADIPDIRDEDRLLRESRGYADGKSAAPMSGKRSNTTATRVRPTTGRNRKVANDVRSNVAERIGRRAADAVSNISKRDIEDADNDNDSLFGSSDSDLDMGGLVGMGATGGGAVGGVGGISGAGFNADINGIADVHDINDDDDDDDFDLNSMDDMSISKITGELAMRPKTASKPEHHSDEDF